MIISKKEIKPNKPYRILASLNFILFVLYTAYSPSGKNKKSKISTNIKLSYHGSFFMIFEQFIIKIKVYLENNINIPSVTKIFVDNNLQNIH